MADWMLRLIRVVVRHTKHTVNFLALAHNASLLRNSLYSGKMVHDFVVQLLILFFKKKIFREIHSSVKQFVPRSG